MKVITLVINDIIQPYVVDSCLTKRSYAPTNHITAPEIVEAVAALKEVTFCRELGLSKVILEGDALQVVNALKASTSNWSPYGHLIEEA